MRRIKCAIGALRPQKPCLTPRYSPALEPLVEIAADRRHQRLDLAVEELVGAGNDLLLDDDAFIAL
jgi:hypothetical protein